MNDAVETNAVPVEAATEPSLEGAAGPANNRQLDDFMAKIILRVFNSCPLLAGYIVRQFRGNGCVELVFNELPQEVLTQLVTVFGGCPYEMYKFCIKNEPCLGFRLKPRPEDLSDLDHCETEEPCDDELLKPCNDDPTE